MERWNRWKKTERERERESNQINGRQMENMKDRGREEGREKGVCKYREKRGDAERAVETGRM